MKKARLLQKIAIGGAFLMGFTCVFFYAQKTVPMKENGTIMDSKADEGKEGGEEPSIPPKPSPVPSGKEESGSPGGIEGEDGDPGESLPEGIWANVRGIGESVLIDELSGYSRTIVIEKRESGYEKTAVVLEELYAQRQIRVVISGLQTDEVSEEQVLRISEDTLCKGVPPTPTPTATPTPTPEPGMEDTSGMGTESSSQELSATLTGSPTPSLSQIPTPMATEPLLPTLSPEDPYYAWRFDPVKEIEISTSLQEDGSFEASILLTLDKTYVYQLYEDEWNYYILLQRPKDVYQKIVVVDAGHGGLDIGTYSAGYAHYEKTVCLNVLLYLKELLDAQDEIQVYYTRTTDWKPSLMQRANLANDVEADFFLSVHCNGSESKALNGTEVLYSAAQNGWEGMNSKKFARICQDKLIAAMGLKDRGLVPRDHNVTIIQQAKMPVALVELAFMSNASDMALLEKPETQKKIAQALYESILEAYDKREELERELEREINEGNELAEQNKSEFVESSAKGE